MSLPPFLNRRDPDERMTREWMQRCYQQRGDQDRPLLLNTGYGPEPLTVEVALEWAERLADEVLG